MSAEQTSIFDTPVHTMARRDDPSTSHKAARVAKFNAGSQKYMLLTAYARNEHGLTDEEAAQISDLLHVGFWKRCSELRNAGYIERTGETRIASSGAPQDVCRITEGGMMAISI